MTQEEQSLLKNVVDEMIEEKIRVIHVQPRWSHYLGIIMVLSGLSFPFFCYFDLWIVSFAGILETVPCDTVLKFYYLGYSIIYSVILLVSGLLLSFREWSSFVKVCLKGIIGLVKVVSENVEFREVK